MVLGIQSSCNSTNMQLLIWISLVPVLSYAAPDDPVPREPPLYSDADSLSENSRAFNDFDTSSPIRFDSTAPSPDFSDPASSSPLDTEWLTDPSSFYTNLYADSSDSSLETTSLFADSFDAFLQSSCEGPDNEAFSKRDGEICAPRAPADGPLPLLDLPDLDDLEESLTSSDPEKRKRRRQREHKIPRIEGYTLDNDPWCPKPKRRLCCGGPLTGLFLGAWLVVNECRGMVSAPTLFFDKKKSSVSPALSYR